MKKICTTALYIGIFLFLFNNKPCSADVSLGLSAWYTEWQFMNEENNMDLNPALLIGPTLSVRLDDSWSIGTVLLYGKFTSKNNDDGGSDINRFDSDISLNYNINRYFKIFTGGKFMGYMWDEDSGTGKHWSAGPGLGIGATLPLFNNFYLLFNLSGTYSWGKHDNVSGTDPGLKETGLNSSLSIAYYITSASTSISLGFRDHFLMINYNQEGEHYEDENINFYGVTLSIIYTF